MSRLLNYGVGEIVDRLTILELKITTAFEKGGSTEHWDVERIQLLTKIHARTLNGAWFDHVSALAVVNALIWHAEDDLRAWRSVGPVYTPSHLEEIRILAFRLQSLNDRRAELVYRINKEAGDGDTKDKG